ncbi:MAG: hypothetical protein K2X27_00425 [Candidatus Obscuribacterales bacterium]|nr:hypothetical protein [Candidatus Obscuribacterales bacterium]
MTADEVLPPLVVKEDKQDLEAIKRDAEKLISASRLVTSRSLRPWASNAPFQVTRPSAVPPFSGRAR